MMHDLLVSPYENASDESYNVHVLFHYVKGSSDDLGSGTQISNVVHLHVDLLAILNQHAELVEYSTQMTIVVATSWSVSD